MNPKERNPPRFLGRLRTESREEIKRDKDRLFYLEGHPLRCIRKLDSGRRERILGRTRCRRIRKRSKQYVYFRIPPSHGSVLDIVELEVEEKKRFPFTRGYLPVYGPNESIQGYVAVRSRRPLILLWLLLILAAFLCLSFATRCEAAPEEPPYPAATASDAIREGEAPRASYKAELSRLQSLADSSMVNVSMNAGPSLCENGKYNVLIENIPQNRYEMVVELQTESGEALWTSPKIEPGQSIEYATLDRALPSGQTPARALFLLYKPESGGYAGSTSVKITLNT